MLKNIPHNNNNSNELVNLRLKETLQVFCERNVNLNIQSEQQGCSLIHLAVVRQNRTAVQLLLNQSSLNLEVSGKAFRICLISKKGNVFFSIKIERNFLS